MQIIKDKDSQGPTQCSPHLNIALKISEIIKMTQANIALHLI